MTTKINIAIDGPGGAGKTTIGQLLAAQLGYQFLDSGLLYRHFARFWQRKNARAENQLSLAEIISQWKKAINQAQVNLITECEKDRVELGTSFISDLASQLSPTPELRQVTLDFQQQLTKNKGWVVVGRDITSTVLPDAEVKIFLTASLEVRAQRRYRQAAEKTTLAAIIKELQARDLRDQQRKISPLIKTSDSWELDTTNLSPEESVEKIKKNNK